MNSMRPDPDSPEAWLLYAKSDLALAGAENVPGVLPENLCFHAQQAAEKSVKAILVSRSLPFPKTHSLELLISMLPDDIERTPILLDATRLTEYATVFRYPGDTEPVTEDEYHSLLEIAVNVVRWAEEIIEP